MKHHTTQLAFRASHIAQREAQLVFDRTHDFSKSLDTFLSVYSSTIQEFTWDRSERRLGK